MPTPHDLRVAAARLREQAGGLATLLAHADLGPDAWSGRAADRFRDDLTRQRSGVARAVFELESIAASLLVAASTADAAAAAAPR
jgi:hypothetical protein